MIEEKKRFYGVKGKLFTRQNLGHDSNSPHARPMGKRESGQKEENKRAG